eukprot:COSAG02_NODE_68222_length_251_cov_0.671053_1_plen_33_part_10
MRRRWAHAHAAMQHHAITPTRDAHGAMMGGIRP